MPGLPDGVVVLHGEPIHDVRFVPLRRIPDERGTILHMLRATDDHFIGFGEVYFTTLYQGIVKGWHRHRDMTLNYACPYGRVKLVIFDERDDSPTRGSLMEAFLGVDSHLLAVIPPGVWNGIKAISAPFALVANCATHTHDPARTSRLDPFDNHIPYDWEPRQH
ncbi:MAG: dTDP-4-dehydrorhamnose 3,5-epimerase family protein [Actinomycetota bacterium]